MGALIVSGLVALAAANAAWWWRRDRVLQARIRILTAQRDHARGSRNYWREQASRARAEEREATRQVRSLTARNEMLTDLMGGHE